MIKQQIQTTALFSSLDATTDELIDFAQQQDEKKLNKIPFRNSWTALQVLIHLTKSNNAIAQGLRMQGEPAERDPEQNVEHIKTMFLNFNVQYKSPAFILPEKGKHNKQEVLHYYNASVESLQNGRSLADLCEIIELPAFGAVTKLELMHFVLYHTQRHVRQIKNIITSITRSDVFKASDQ